MDNPQPFVEAIQTVYPELAVETAVFNQQGQYNIVLVVNDGLIFRFPRYAGGLEQLALETKILTAVQSYLPLPVPNPIYTNFADAPVGEAFMGYQYIPGEPLYPPAFAKIADKAALAAQIAHFLQALHAVPIRDLIDEPLPVSDTEEEWWDVYGRIQTKLFPYMRLDACKEVAHHFESALDDPAQVNFEPTLRHGDFGTGNLLHNPRTGQMSGIIDFGFTVLGDPAFDLAGLLNYGESFVQEIALHYPAVEQYWPRIRFYNGTFALYEALFGIENGDEQAFQQGIAQYV
ncbi:phosphotransferase family protein [Candidatus Leptofilum sp.]|uniref:phosphotransferase family protein n=1 Tax=Candidatus Leptofilum sp. TaxID=3241576 RepID=UPI003B5A7F06